ncbi:hypothetical protein [Streptococcus phage 93]|nr:hypothetical protein [Streptococcus phage 93]
MTREEAVKKLVTAGRLSVAHAEDLYDSIIPKPVVPQYVADWYEEHKDEFYLNLHRVVRDFFEHFNDYYFSENPIDYDFACWYYNTKNAIQILVNMHQFGYEVEGEKKYTVRIRNLDDEETYLNYDNFRETWVFYSREDTDRFRTTHTKKTARRWLFWMGI